MTSQADLAQEGVDISTEELSNKLTRAAAALRRMADEMDLLASQSEKITRDPNGVVSQTVGLMTWGVANIGLGSMADSAARIYQYKSAVLTAQK